MANKTIVLFAVQFKGDGSSTSYAVNLLNGGAAFYPNGGSPGAPSLLSSITNSLPSAIADVTCPGLTVSSSSYALGVLSVTFSANPTNNTVYTVSGTLEF